MLQFIYGCYEGVWEKKCDAKREGDGGNTVGKLETNLEYLEKKRQEGLKRKHCYDES
jgi:hypothetical protein